MRCRACNAKLNDKEATRKYASAPTVFIDLCNHCFSTVADDIPDLESEAVADFDDEDVGNAVDDFLSEGGNGTINFGAEE